MNTLGVVADRVAKTLEIESSLAHGFELQFIDRRKFRDTVPPDSLLIDIDLRDDILFSDLLDWLRLRRNPRHLIVMITPHAPLDSVRAAHLGATDICARPLDQRHIYTALLGDFDALMLDLSLPPLRTFPKIGAALDALGSVFSASRFGSEVNMDDVRGANEGILEIIEEKGLESWLDITRRHHSQTYQHSLVATGVVAAFCRHLGFSIEEQTNMCIGAMMHDVGKAQIPISILEKPAALDLSELVVMREHPTLGFQSLQGNKNGLNSNILEMVLHHHEMLDGSGYPDHLSAADIKDPVRIMTICDIYAALVERRSYKASMTTDRAYRTLVEMGSRLDRDILREFAFAGEARLAA